ITVPGAASATGGQAEADTKPEAKAQANAQAIADPNADAQAKAMAQKFNCLACHGIDTKLVGPSFVEIARRYAKQNGAEALLVGRVRQGASGTWGPVPMPPNAAVNDADGKAMVSWILRMAK
ncbi:MAG: c-type cytochrome, partial [Burkholderiaceae bacterium]